MPSDFRAQLDAAYKTKVEERLHKGVRITALQVFRNIVQTTPVKYGVAKLSWNIDINVIDVTVATAPAQAPDASFDGSEKALQAVASFKLDDIIYISNNLPYIRALNDGHSKQAPSGYIDAAIDVGTRQGQELIDKL